MAIHIRRREFIFTLGSPNPQITYLWSSPDLTGRVQIIPEWWATSSRNGGRDHLGIREASNRSRVTDGSPGSARDLFEAALNEAACCFAWLWALHPGSGTRRVRSACLQPEISAGARMMIRSSR